MRSHGDRHSAPETPHVTGHRRSPPRPARRYPPAHRGQRLRAPAARGAGGWPVGAAHRLVRGADRRQPAGAGGRRGRGRAARRLVVGAGARRARGRLLGSQRLRRARRRARPDHRRPPRQRGDRPCPRQPVPRHEPSLVERHNRHHANPNHIDKDPDVAVGALVWTRHQAALRQGFTRWLTRHQARLFFPMLLLEGLNLKLSGLRDLRRQGPRERVVEASLLAVLSPGKAAVLALVHHALFGLYLGMAFAPGHKGMDMPDPRHDRWGHLKRQVVTSRNIRGGRATDWLLGGLNYQIEHHLFPSMARPHLPLGPGPGQGTLRAARPAVHRDRPRRLLRLGPTPHARRRGPAPPARGTSRARQPLTGWRERHTRRRRRRRCRTVRRSPLAEW